MASISFFFHESWFKYSKIKKESKRKQRTIIEERNRSFFSHPGFVSKKLWFAIVVNFFFITPRVSYPVHSIVYSSGWGHISGVVRRVIMKRGKDLSMNHF